MRDAFVCCRLMNGTPVTRERERLRALGRYGMLDTLPEHAFDRVTRLAARLLGMPFAYLAFVDDEREWLKSTLGFSVEPVQRSVSFAGAAIVSDEVLVVPDAAHHPRFAANPMVTGGSGIRFVVAAPLKSLDGFRVGALAVADREPHTLNEDDLATLTDLAALAEDELEQHRAVSNRPKGDGRRTETGKDQEALLELGATGIVSSASPSVEQFLGYAPNELVGADLLARVDSDDVLKIRDGFLQAIARPQTAVPVELRVRHRDGSLRILQGVIHALRDGTEPARFALSARDITAKRQEEAGIQLAQQELERRVAQRTAELEAANQELEAFSYSVSHDLRAPLRLINSFSRVLLLEYSPPLSEEPRRYLQIIYDNAQQMGSLLDALLNFSRLSLQPLRKQRVIVSELIRQVLAELLPQGAGQHIVVTIGELPACSADPVLLRQVFANILSNALKFTRRRQTALIEVGYQLSGEMAGWLEYYIKDNGVGFDMRYADRLFGVFQRLHASDEFEGAGVGLAIVERIIRRHGGRVWAQSTLDQGTTIFFTAESEG